MKLYYKGKKTGNLSYSLDGGNTYISTTLEALSNGIQLSDDASYEKIKIKSDSSVLSNLEVIKDIVCSQESSPVESSETDAFFYIDDLNCEEFRSEIRLSAICSQIPTGVNLNFWIKYYSDKDRYCQLGINYCPENRLYWDEGDITTTVKPIPDDLIARFEQGIQIYYCYELNNHKSFSPWPLKVKLKQN